LLFNLHSFGERRVGLTGNEFGECVQLLFIGLWGKQQKF